MRDVRNISLYVMKDRTHTGAGATEDRDTSGYSTGGGRLLLLVSVVWHA